MEIGDSASLDPNALSSPYLVVISLSPPFIRRLIFLVFVLDGRTLRFPAQVCVSLKLDAAEFSLLFVEIDEEPNATTRGFK